GGRRGCESHSRWLGYCKSLVPFSGFSPERSIVQKPCRNLPLVFRAVILNRMSDVTRILSAIERGDPNAAEQLLPLVYDELRKLAAQKMAKEAPGQTLEATALVHEAYLRLVDVKKV